MSLAKRIPIFLLRLLALGAAVTATVIMVTSKDSAQVFNMKFEAKFTDSPTFKYFALINAIASGYTLIMLFFPSKNSCGHLILVFDLIMALLLDSSISACLAIGQVGKKGNSHAGWLPICGQVPKFCDRVTGAVIAGFLAAVIYLLIFLYSLHNFLNLFSLKS
ncbi:CASP-like protein 1C1 [Olea europaea var. sylvestris]|uniref:CASP-like protein 1C1 n=1 Tax=Olea europaea var. sylvestris TaxID=158386 RepID=UPI000C1D62F3|nr:CASP-like protein 1C1 [Olea europaea var. sylvestris]